MEKGWLIYFDDGFEVYQDLYRVYLDETEALEAYMTLVEEQLYWIFCNSIMRDRHETRSPQEVAESMPFHYSDWCVQQVPVYIKGA